MPLALPEKASFSSLNLLLFNPYQWLLQYGAKIQASKSLSLSDSFLLNGSLAHRLAEHFFSRTDALTMDAADFATWFSIHFPRVVREEGAVLLMEGRGADLSTLRHRVLRAMTQLRAHLANANVRVVTAEQALDGQFAGGALAGAADLVLTTEDGHRAIVDMKWAGGKKYPEQLKANRHLQLAIYAELLRQETNSLPSVAYFILESARLLTPDDRVFADSERVPANPPSTTPDSGRVSPRPGNGVRRKSLRASLKWHWKVLKRTRIRHRPRKRCQWNTSRKPTTTTWPWPDGSNDNA